MEAKTHKTLDTILFLLLLAVLAAIVLVLPNLAAAETLVWDPSTGVVDGYRVYLDGAELATVPPTQDTITNSKGQTADHYYRFPDGTFQDGRVYTVGVTAFNAAGESAPASVSYLKAAMPGQLTNIRIWTE